MWWCRCILDTKAREFSADSTTLLTQLANMVMREVERKRAMNDALCSAAVRHNRCAQAAVETGEMERELWHVIVTSPHAQPRGSLDVFRY